MNKAVFLDRDGIINRERGDYTFRMEDFQFVEGIIENIGLLKKNAYLIIVISNQGGIGRNRYSKADVEKLHQHMCKLLREHQLVIDEIYYCPHHPSNEYCLCRKPDSLMLEKAIARFDIDPNRSYFIGDAERDMDAGRKAGVCTLLVKPNQNLRSHINQIIR